MYYSNSAVSSVYVFDIGETIEQGFICCLLIKNSKIDFILDVKNLKSSQNSFLDSINIVNVKFFKEKEKEHDKIKVLYKLTSTMILSINFQSNSINNGDISINLTKQVYIELILA